MLDFVIIMDPIPSDDRYTIQYELIFSVITYKYTKLNYRKILNIMRTSTSDEALTVK